MPSPTEVRSQTSPTPISSADGVALDSMDEVLDRIGAMLYNLASMLVGEGEESIGLVEQAIGSTEISICHDPSPARKNSRLVLCRAALEAIARRTPESLAAPTILVHVETCLDEDDLEGAGISREELDRMMAGSERARVRRWLESLPAAVRTVFVLRAVAGLSGVETVALLVDHGGPKAAGWTPETVRELFRQGLCSLASQLIQASAGR